MRDPFWTASENFDYPDSPDLIGKLKTAGNLFFESSEPVSRKQINEVLNTLVDYPNLRFIKFEAPNLTASWSSTPEAEDYLHDLSSE